MTAREEKAGIGEGQPNFHPTLHPALEISQFQAKPKKKKNALGKLHSTEHPRAPDKGLGWIGTGSISGGLSEWEKEDDRNSTLTASSCSCA